MCTAEISWGKYVALWLENTLKDRRVTLIVNAHLNSNLDTSNGGML